MCTLLWYNFSSPEPVPGPGSYNPHVYRTSSKRCAPAFTMSRTPREIGITQNCTFWGKVGKNVWIILWTLLDQQHLSSSRDATFSPPRHRSFGIQQVKGLAFDIRHVGSLYICCWCNVPCVSVSQFLHSWIIMILAWQSISCEKKFSVLSALLDHFNTEIIFS